MSKTNREIVEKRLGIPGSYQYHALTSGPWPKRNWHSNKLVITQSCLTFNRDQTLLDLGIGSGNLELRFATSLKKIDGVDYHDKAIKFLQTKLKERGITNVSLYLSSVQKLPRSILKRRYDFITIIDTLEHLRIIEAKLLVNKLALLLKRGGQLFIITPNYTSPWRFLEIFLETFSLVPKFSGEQHLTQFNLDKLLETVRSAGLTVTEQGSFNLFSWLLPNTTLSHFLAGLEKRFLNRSGCLIYMTGQKL